jgi:hypothetical protein
VSLAEVRALARCPTFARLDVRNAVLVVPDEHAERLLLLLRGGRGSTRKATQDGS